MLKHTLMLMILPLSLIMTGSARGETPVKKIEAGKVKNLKKCLFPKSRKRAPEWVCKALDDSETVTAVGSFHKSGAGIEFMEQMASADARVNLAKKLRGTGSKKLTDEQLQGSRVIKKIYGPKGALYILIGIDKAAAQKLE
jgi:hypothetical protein